MFYKLYLKSYNIYVRIKINVNILDFCKYNGFIHNVDYS